MLTMPAPVCFRSRVISSSNLPLRCDDFGWDRGLMGQLQKGTIQPSSSEVGTSQPPSTSHIYIYLRTHPYIDSPPRPVPVGSPPWIMKSLMIRWKIVPS